MKHPAVVAAILSLVVGLHPVLSPPARGQGPGGINSGGGTRSAGGIQAVDAVGTAFAGDAAGQQVRAQSGFISGLPIVTPVALRTFHVAMSPQGVEVRWEGAEEMRFNGFFLERAEGSRDQEPAEGAYQRVDGSFIGPGPHQYLDSEVEVGKTYYYRLGWVTSKSRERIGPWSVFVDPGAGFRATEIFAAHPNPFQEAFVVSMFLGQSMSVHWRVHDLQGRTVVRGGISQVPAGYYSHRIRPLARLSGGVYFLRVVTGDQEHVQKIIALP